MPHPHPSGRSPEEPPDLIPYVYDDEIVVSNVSVPLTGALKGAEFGQTDQAPEGSPSPSPSPLPEGAPALAPYPALEGATVPAV